MRKPPINFELQSKSSNLAIAGVAAFCLTAAVLFAGITTGSKVWRKKRFLRNRRKNKHSHNRANQVKKVSTGVGVVVLDQETNKVVVGLRKSTHGENTWAFPGGWLERGESFEGCAIRELFEETGLTVKDHIQSCKMIETAPYLNHLLLPPKGSQAVSQKSGEESETSSLEGKETLKLESFYSVSAFVLIKLKRGVRHDVELKEKDKCVEWRWIDLSSVVDHIGQFPLFPALKHFVSLKLNLQEM